VTDAVLTSQRLMRDRLNAALKRGLVAALDVGSSKVACFIIKLDPSRISRNRQTGALGGYGAMRIIGAGVTRSRGVRQGEIVDMEEAERAIRTALEIAEKMAGERVDQVIGVISGARPESFPSSAEVDVLNGAVCEADVARVLGACAPQKTPPGREILHAMPVNFALDGASGLTDPRGMTGAALAADMHVVTVASAPLRNLAQCVKRCDLELAGVVAAPFVSGLATLVEDEQDLGGACVDLGGGSSSVSLFLRRQLIYTGAVRIGGDHVTLDIAQAFSMSAAAAERLKTLHGGVYPTKMDDREYVDAPQIGEDAGEERRRVPRSALIGVIRPRIEETLEGVRDQLEHAGFNYMPGRQIVLTGGSCQLPGMMEAAQRILGRRVRIGRPIRVAGLPQSAAGPAFAAAVGLSVYAVRQHDEVWDFDAISPDSPRGRFGQAMRWFRKNW